MKPRSFGGGGGWPGRAPTYSGAVASGAVERCETASGSTGSPTARVGGSVAPLTGAKPITEASNGAELG